MDSNKNDEYFIQKIRTDLAFVVEHTRDIDQDELSGNDRWSRYIFLIVILCLGQKARQRNRIDARVLSEIKKCDREPATEWS